MAQLLVPYRSHETGFKQVLLNMGWRQYQYILNTFLNVPLCIHLMLKVVANIMPVVSKINRWYKQDVQ